jgi:thiol-disulfide isomerase/thioredoxin
MRGRCLVTLAVLALALGSTPHASATTPHSSAPSGVAWFKGDVAHAFDAAGAQRKPVFVYFGAVWCPPCQELKATIFRRKDFLDRLTLFVPVYLDGDAPDAQRWADRFHITGYPTVLILKSDGSELERISGGMDLARYAEVLDAGLAAVRPIREILATLDRSTMPLSQDECRLLAYNGWQADDEWIDSDDHAGWLAHTAEQLNHAAERCPVGAPVERARLQITAAAASAQAEADFLKAGKAPSPALAAAVGRVAGILGQSRLAEDVGDTLLGLPNEYFVAAARLDPAHSVELEHTFDRRMDALASDPRYSTATQLYAIDQKVVAAKALEPGGKVPAALATEAHQRLEGVLASVHEPFARTSVVNAALNILDDLGDQARSYTVLLNELKISATPYYYMTDLADLEEKRGHKDAAIDWLARAYRESQGAATRIQWGSRYVRGLIRMRPADERAIRSAALQVLGEVRDGEPIYGRNRFALDLMASRLHDWNHDGQHTATMAAIRASMGQACHRSSQVDSASAGCNGVLAKL